MATWFWIIIGLLVVFLLFMNGDKPKGTRRSEKVTLQQGIEGEYTIKGINMSGITDKHLGHFDGIAKAITGNDYDPYAVAIYVANKRIGWLPAGCVDVHTAIKELGGSIRVHVYIGKAVDEDDGHEFYFGKVQTGL
jgi:hypothetical protein